MSAIPRLIKVMDGSFLEKDMRGRLCMLERQMSLNIIHTFIFFSRLVHDEDVTKTADQGGFNINILITGFIWATFLIFF